MRALVVAKAPVPGRVKTRLGAVIGMDAAARVAAAALLDTLSACRSAFAECHLALDGDLRGACEEDELRDRLGGWVVHPQRGTTQLDMPTNGHHPIIPPTADRTPCRHGPGRLQPAKRG